MCVKSLQLIIFYVRKKFATKNFYGTTPVQDPGTLQLKKFLKFLHRGFICVSSGFHPR